MFEHEVRKEQVQQERKYENKRFRKEYEDNIDELLPKNVGREAMLEKKRLLNQKINGGKDESGFDEIKDSEIFGDEPKSSFQRAKDYQLSRQLKKQQMKQQEKEEAIKKIQEYNQLEKQKLQQILNNDLYDKFKHWPCTTCAPGLPSN